MKKLSFKKILVPVDFSEMSIAAIDTAKKVAARFGGRLCLLHVHEPVYPARLVGASVLMEPETFPLIDDSEKRLTTQLRDLAARFDVDPNDCHVVIAAPAYDAICRFVGSNRIDLTIMPTHGRTGFRHALLGSTAERVVQHSPAPVFIVRDRTEMRTILVPVDFSPCSLEALKLAVAFAGSIGARIVAFHSVMLMTAFTSDGYPLYDFATTAEALRKNAQELMKEFLSLVRFGDVPFSSAVVVGPVINEICAMTEKQDVDLIITATHGRTGFKHVFIGSVAEKIVRHAPVPVMVVPSNASAREQRLTSNPPASRIVCRAPIKRSQRLKAHDEKHVHPFPERRKTNRFREAHVHA